MSSKNSKFTFENPHRFSRLYIPSSAYFIARLVLSHLKRKYKNDESIAFEKASGFIDSLKSGNPVNDETGQKPSIALAPDLRAKPWWLAQNDEALAVIENTLKQHSDEIVEEFIQQSNQQLVTGSYAPARRYGELPEGAWTGYQISNITGVKADARKRFPETAAVIQSLGFRVISSDFLAMEPGTHLPIHTDGTNVVLACQMGISGPEHCALSVMKQAKPIHPGTIVFFDQSFPHTAWNNGKERRVVLVLSLVHPDISEKEFLLVKEFMRKSRRLAYVFAPILLLEMLLHRLRMVFIK